GTALWRRPRRARPKCGPGVREDRVTPAPCALLRAGFARSRGAPLRPPEDHVVELLDGDGRAIARAAPRPLDEAPPLASASLRRAVPVRYHAAEDGGRRGTSGAVGPPGARPAQQTAAPSPPSFRRGWYAFGAFLLPPCLFVLPAPMGATRRPCRASG